MIIIIFCSTRGFSYEKNNKTKQTTNDKNNKTYTSPISEYLRNVPHLNEKVMWTLVSFVLCGVSVFIRRQQLTPKFSVSSFEGGHVHRKARRIAEAFKCAIKVVVHGEWSNSRHIQIMKLVFYKCMLSDTLKNWVRILGIRPCVARIEYQTPRLNGRYF